MRKYNILITDVENDTVTDLKGATVSMILKTLKSLNRNSLDPQPMKITKKKSIHSKR